MYVTKRKRVVRLPNREIDFGAWKLTDFIMPDCFASRAVFAEAWGRLSQFFAENPDYARKIEKTIGLDAMVIKEIWNVVNVKVKYRGDDPVFQTPDFWLCFPSDTIVSGASVKISDISVGEKVLDIDGEHSTVIRTFKRWYSGDLIEVKAVGLLPVRMTPDHPVLVVKRLKCGKNRLCNRFLKNSIPRMCKGCIKFVEHDWSPRFVEAKHLEKGDYLLIPRRKDNRIRKNLPIPLNKRTSYLLGLYLAEGSTSDHQVQLAFGKHETELIEKARAIVEEELGLKASVVEGDTDVIVAFGNKRLKVFFKTMFGSNARNKRIPEFIKELPKDMLWEFIRGYYDGDGCVIKHRGKDYVNIGTSSIYIVYDMIEILAKLGILPSIRKLHDEKIEEINGRKIKFAPVWSISFPINPSELKRMHYRVDENYIYTPITSIRKVPFNGYVYNVSTTSKTYCVPFVVHNCPNETWGMGKGDCEDTTFLLESAIRGFSREAEAYACIGFYVDPFSRKPYGHAWVIYKASFYPKWLWLETTWDTAIVYWSSEREAHRVDRDYEMLGLTEEYVDAHRELIDAMIDYVEAGRWLRIKWMHKGRRVPAALEKIVLPSKF